MYAYAAYIKYSDETINAHHRRSGLKSLSMCKERYKRLLSMQFESMIKLWSWSWNLLLLWKEMWMMA